MYVFIYKKKLYVISVPIS